MSKIPDNIKDFGFSEVYELEHTIEIRHNGDCYRLDFLSHENHYEASAFKLVDGIWNNLTDFPWQTCDTLDHAIRQALSFLKDRVKK